MERLNPSARRDAYGSKINRDHSPVLAYGLPWLTIILGSLAPLLPTIALAPVVPPLGYMMLLAWRLARPGLLPMWAGLPLGFIDDMYSGQPLGSGILLFSLTMIALELLEMRFPWRSFWYDWLTAAGFLVIYLFLAALVSGADLTWMQFQLLIPQALLTVLLFPIIAKVVSLFDRMRLSRVRRIG
ncbi:rod shape-determining protein MreD [Aurantiacibacter gangjinensis]|uniref:Rod shape-determining protein MreD n=1 Tax=Aurantiacibacter gangjinensis TaxID=502682 RepID=A0A0G9MU37_9SPHN|nr:rod shape-determining protein MreD [Aurantiacibacter gangjinensis]APE28683.1 Rod shape-determining protein MreD [Aurantiacibacter gangjinensis]KLE32848.1 rod shape-determining protein MreD [Aurantiacibacter gangjinensis]